MLTPASLADDAPTIDNVRIWDPRPLIATYRQLQEIRLYYDFRDVDVDRYKIQGRYSQVMLSPRELNPSLLPESAQTWVNQHLKFTHGSGLAMSPVRLKDSEGLPIFYLKDIPAKSSVGLHIDQPGIYFGGEPDNYAVVDAASPEFDYPSGSDNVFAYYTGGGGIPVSGLWRRLLFSFFYRDINLLVTDNIVAKSRILIRRNISDRIARIAPFLSQDHDPYMVIHERPAVLDHRLLHGQRSLSLFAAQCRRDQLHPQLGQSGDRRLHRRDRLLRLRPRRPGDPHLAGDFPRAVQAARRRCPTICGPISAIPRTSSWSRRISMAPIT